MTEDIPAPVTNGFEEKAREVGEGRLTPAPGESFEDFRKREALMFAAISTALEEAVREEREACAKIAETTGGPFRDVNPVGEGYRVARTEIATAIRSRS